MRRRRGLTALVIAGWTALSACASITVDTLPQPGKTYSDGYSFVLQFDNVLNLPDRAKVVLDGTTVGVVTAVAVGSDSVAVTVRVGPRVVVPSNIHAILQQATVLGDIYVALERPQPDDTTAPALHEGAIIPLSQTTSPPQLEDTIASMSNFVASGSVQRVQESIIRINRVTPSGDEAVRKLAARFAVDMSDLAHNMDQVDLLVNNAAHTADAMNTAVPSLAYWFSEEGLKKFRRGLYTTSFISYALPAVGSVYSDGYWLTPLLTSLATATGAIRQSKLAVEDEIPRWRHLFTDSFLAQDKYPAINITSIVGPDGREISEDVQKVFRILGAMP